MAVKNGEIAIFGKLVNDTDTGILAGAEQIYDSNLSDNQENINKKIFSSLENISDIDVSATPTKYQIIYTTFDNKKLLNYAEESDLDYSGEYRRYDYENSEYYDEPVVKYKYKCLSHEFYPTLGYGVITYDNEIIYSPIFEEETNIKDIFFGESLLVISENAFEDQKIESVIFSETSNFITICDNAFNNCKNLKNVSLNKVSIIGNYAFNKCYSLSSLNLSYTNIIGEDAFSNCSNLSNLILATGSYIDDYAFSHCISLTSISLSYNDKSLYFINDAEYIFSECPSITSIPILKDVPSYCFSECNNLRTIVLDNSDISSYAFDNLGIISISGSVDTIDKFVFNNCDNLKYVNLTINESFSEQSFDNAYNIEYIKLNLNGFCLENVYSYFTIDSTKLKVIDITYDVGDGIKFPYILTNCLEKIIIRSSETVDNLEYLSEENLLSEFKIYVNAELLTKYKQKYSELKTRFYPIYGENEFANLDEKIDEAIGSKIQDKIDEALTNVDSLVEDKIKEIMDELDPSNFLKKSDIINDENTNKLAQIFVI